MQGRGFLTGAIKTFEDVPVQQRSHNPRMAEANFEKVTCHALHPGIARPSFIHSFIHSFIRSFVHSFIRSFVHSFIHYTPFNPQIRCGAADILWQPSSLPCLGISSTGRGITS